MPGRIKGITIEIGGDTTKLNKALEKTDGQLEKSRTNLRDINKLLKMDPGNTVLLEQKQKNLANAICETKNRLQTLKQAEEQMRGTDMTAEQRQQYEALQREIISTETDLKRLENQMRDFGSVGAQKIAALGDKFEKVGGKIKAAGESISGAGEALLPVTAAIVGLGTASVAAWKEIDAGGDTIARLTGATGAALQDLQKQANELATEIPTDFESAGKAIGEISTRFDLQGDALKDLAGEYIKFADITGADVAGAVDMTQKAMAAWGVETNDTAKYLDALTAASQKSGVKIETIAQQATTNAAALKELGFTASDAAMFLGQLEKNGVDASGAMAGLKKAYAKALKDGSSLSETLKEIETGLTNESTKAEAAATAIELFGARSGGALVEAISTGRLSFDQLGTTLDDFAGTVGSTFEATLDPLDKVKSTLNELKLSGADLVEAAGPLINDVLASASEAAKGLSKWLNTLTDDEKRLLVKSAAAVAAAGPALIVVGKTVSAVGSLTEGVGKTMKLAPKIKTGITAVKGAFTALNPAVLAVGGAFTAISIPFALLIKHHQDYIKETYGLTEAQKESNAAIAEAAEATRQAEQARREAISGVDSEIGQYSRLWDELQSLVDENGKVKEGYEARASVIAGILNDALGTEIELTGGAIQNYDELTDSMDKLIEKKRVMAYLEANQGAYENALKGVSAAQTEYYKKVAETSKAYDQLAAAREALAAAEAASDPTSPAYVGQVGNIMHLASVVQEAEKTYNEMKAAQDDAAESYYTLQNTISNTEALMVAAESGEGLSETMQNVANGFVTAENATRSMLENQLANFESTYQAMKTAAESGQADITAAELREMKRMVDMAKAELDKGGVDAGKAYAAGMDSTTGDASTAGADLKNAAETGMGNDQYGDGYSKGENYGRGLANGLEAHYDRVRNAAIRLAGAIPKATATTLQERSPSKIGEHQAENFGESLVIGMDNKVREVAAAAQRLAGAMITGNASPMIRFPDTQAAAQNITVTAPAAPTDGTVARALNVIISQLGNLGVTVRNADGVTNYINKRMGRISTLEAEGVI